MSPAAAFGTTGPAAATRVARVAPGPRPSPSPSQVAASTCQRPGLQRVTVCRAAASVDDKMREAEARWESQVREGKVRNVVPKVAGKLQKDGWVVLDVRPPGEVKRASVEGAVAIPLFKEDKSMAPGQLLKQMSAFGMGGWWLGSEHTEPNDDFMPEVLAKIPKDASIVVCCQKGLRSLAACEQLNRAGYSNLAWINGGLDTARPGDMQTRDGVDLRYGGIGGISKFMGWTEVQQEENAEQGGASRYEGALKLAGVVLAVDLLVFLGEQVNYMINSTPQ